jgi:hypothetical protein
VVVLLIAALPTRREAALALGVFAPTSVASMTAFTAAFAWILTRPIIETVYRSLLIPGLGVFGVMFGALVRGDRVDGRAVKTAGPGPSRSSRTRYTRALSALEGRDCPGPWHRTGSV